MALLATNIHLFAIALKLDNNLIHTKVGAYWTVNRLDYAVLVKTYIPVNCENVETEVINICFVVGTLGDRITFCIFMASITATSCPSRTVCPTY